MVWSFEGARDRFDELLDRAESEGPQRILRGNHTYIVMYAPEDEKERNRLVEIITSGPSWGDLETLRNQGKMRDIEFQVARSTYRVNSTIPIHLRHPEPVRSRSGR